MKISTLVLPCLFVSLLACSSSTPYTGHHPVQRTSNTEMNSFTFIDHNLNRTDITKFLGMANVKNTVKVTIDSSGIRSTPTGTIEVWATLRNRTDYDLQVEGMTSFYDEGKAPLDDRSSWKRVMIPANGTALYKESSLSANAEYFLVELREGR